MTRRAIALNLLFAAITLVCLIGLALSQRSGPEHTLRIGLLGSRDDEDFHGARAFEAHVEAGSQGRIAVEIFPSGQFCSSARECLEALQSGLLDVHMTTVGGLGTVMPEAQVLDLPYAFANDAVAECALDGPLSGQLRDAVLDNGLAMRLMTISNTGGWRNFATSDRPVRHPDDLVGLKIRTTAAPLQQALTRQLAANPTPVAWAELYTALATGVVAGTKNSVQDIVGMQFHEHLDHIVLDGHAYMTALWWISEPRWQTFPAELQDLLRAGFARLQTVTRQLPKERAAAAFDAFRKAGGTIHRPSPNEQAAFHAAASGLRQWFVEQYGDRWLARLDAAVARCTPPTT